MVWREGLIFQRHTRGHHRERPLQEPKRSKTKNRTSSLEHVLCRCLIHYYFPRETLRTPYSHRSLETSRERFCPLFLLSLRRRGRHYTRGITVKSTHTLKEKTGVPYWHPSLSSVFALIPASTVPVNHLPLTLRHSWQSFLSGGTEIGSDGYVQRHFSDEILG